MKSILIAASLTLLTAGAALAQGGSPYNSSGSQAGGPLAGQARRAGVPGGTPTMAPRGGDASMAAPMRSRPMKKRRHHRRMR